MSPLYLLSEQYCCSTHHKYLTQFAAEKNKSIALSLFAVNSISLSAKRRVFQPSGRDSHALIASDCSSLFQLPSYYFCFFRTRCQLPVTDPHPLIFNSRNFLLRCSSSAAPANVSEIQMELTFRLTGPHPPSPPLPRLHLAWHHLS